MSERSRLTWSEWLLVVLVGMMALLMMLQIVMRYLFNRPLVFTEEAARFLFVWTVFLGAAEAFRRKAHIGIDVLVKVMPKRLQWATEGLVSVITVGVLIVLFISGVQVVKATSRSSLTTIPLPMSSLYLALPVASALMLLDVFKRITNWLMKRGRK